MSGEQPEVQWSAEQCSDGMTFLCKQCARISNWPVEDTYCAVFNMRWMTSVLQQTKFKSWDEVVKAHDQEPHRYKPARIDAMEMEDFKEIRTVWHGNSRGTSTIKGLRRLFKSFLHKYPEFYHDDIAQMYGKLKARRDELAASTNVNFPFVDWYPAYADLYAQTIGS